MRNTRQNLPGRMTLTTAAVFIAASLAACGGATPAESQPPAAQSGPAEPTDVVSSDPRIQYFHDQLIANGEDIQSDFGSYLLTLKMNPRDLQQDDPKHAYDTVLEEIRKVTDPALQREMAETFFNTPVVP